MIHVNDKWTLDWRPGMSIEDILIACGFTHHHIFVSVNGILIPAEEYATHPVADGDQVRVIHVIGGG